MTQMEKLEQMVKDLGEDQTCPICQNAGQITCPDHMVETDEDGWCLCCDSPDLEKVNCPCEQW